MLGMLLLLVVGFGLLIVLPLLLVGVVLRVVLGIVLLPLRFVGALLRILFGILTTPLVLFVLTLVAIRRLFFAAPAWGRRF